MQEKQRDGQETIGSFPWHRIVVIIPNARWSIHYGLNSLESQGSRSTRSAHYTLRIGVSNQEQIARAFHNKNSTSDGRSPSSPPV